MTIHPAFANRTVDEHVDGYRVDLGGFRVTVIGMSKTTKHANTSKAVAYLRASTDEQHLSPEAQRSAIESWARSNGVTICEWFADLGVSGAAELEKRAALMGSLDALSAHGAGLLVVSKRDRLARDVVACAMIERLAQRAGARVVSAAGEGTGCDDPTSQLMRTIVDAFSQYERALIRARTTAALGVKKSRGERVGTIPYGFSLSADGSTLEPCEAEQAVIARVRGARAAGLSFRVIVAELERAGIKSRGGRPLGLSQLARMVA